MRLSDRLSEQQGERVADWLGSVAFVDDLSWKLTDTAVLHVKAEAGEFIVKAGGEDNHHIGREIAAFREFTEPLTEIGVCARLRAADLELNLMLLEFLAGELVEGSEAEFTPETYEHAGRVLRALHGQSRRVDPDSERLATDRAIAWLDAEHRIDRHHEDAAREKLTGYRPRPVTVVPTHGDWQPRNWLIHHGQVRVIDFGRFAWRSAESDFSRLAAQQWRGQPGLEAAFFSGYGPDSRSQDPQRWRIAKLREAIGTAAWAYHVGNYSFEAQGHRMIAEALA